MKARPRSEEAGLTLVELLIALCLLGTVTAATTAVLSGTFRAWRAAARGIEEQQNARLALEWMVRRLRTIGPTALTSGQPDSIAFVADLGSGRKAHRFCLDPKSWVVRHQSGEDVTPTGCARGAGITNPGGTDLPHVVSLSFAYFDAADGALAVPVDTADLARVRRIRIAMSTGARGRHEVWTTMSLTADVALRGR